MVSFLRRPRPGPILNTLRWSLGAAAMAATWVYGVWKGGYATWLGFPLVALAAGAASARTCAS